MKQLLVTFPKKETVSFEHRSIEPPSDGECLVRNLFTMISPGTELALFAGTHIGFSDPDIQWARYPLTPGYAGIGVVDECRGQDGPAPGTPVLYYPPHSTHGILTPASMVWFAFGKERPSASPIDYSDLLPFLPLRFAQIALTAILARERPSRNVLVYGAGIVGNLCAQLYQLVPGVERVCLTDLSAQRLRLAEECGIRERASPPEVPSIPFDTVVEATGAPAVVGEALERVATRGQVILLGSTRGTVEINVYKQIHRKLVALVGSHESLLPPHCDRDRSASAALSITTVRSQHDALASLVEAVRNGSLHTKPFLQEIIKPSEIETAYQRLQTSPDKHLGICIDWREHGPNTARGDDR